LIDYFLLKVTPLGKSESAIEPIISDLFILLPSSKRPSTITAVPPNAKAHRLPEVQATGA
jgi:hypothetical protein